MRTIYLRWVTSIVTKCVTQYLIIFIGGNIKKTGAGATKEQGRGKYFYVVYSYTNCLFDFNILNI